MPKIKKTTVIKILITTPFLLLLYILQSMVFTHITLFGVKPLILPLAVVGIALFDGHTSGGVVGIFAGMLCDMSFNQSTVVFTITLTLIGIAFGLLSESFLVRGFPSYFLCSAAALFICGFVQAAPFLFFYSTPFSPLFNIMLRQTLYSLILTIPLYYLTRFISRIL